jgi:hypothetical protein
VQSNIQIHVRRPHRRTKSKKFCPYHTIRLRSRQRQRNKSTKVSRHAYIHTYIHIKAHLFDTASPKIGQPCLISSRLVSPHRSTPPLPARKPTSLRMPAPARHASRRELGLHIAIPPVYSVPAQRVERTSEPVRHGMTEPEMETKTHSYSFFFSLPLGTPNPLPLDPAFS